MNRRKITIALISCWALFFGAFGLVASGVTGFSFALESQPNTCIACFYPETFYTPILSWVFFFALAIGFSGIVSSFIFLIKAAIQHYHKPLLLSDQY
jgi:hypothetical protein